MVHNLELAGETIFYLDKNNTKMMKKYVSNFSLTLIYDITANNSSFIALLLPGIYTVCKLMGRIIKYIEIKNH